MGNLFSMLCGFNRHHSAFSSILLCKHNINHTIIFLENLITPDLADKARPRDLAQSCVVGDLESLLKR